MKYKKQNSKMFECSVCSTLKAYYYTDGQKSYCKLHSSPDMKLQLTSSTTSQDVSNMQLENDSFDLKPKLSNEQKCQLLQSIEKYGQDWDQISQSMELEKDECIEAFIQLGTQDSKQIADTDESEEIDENLFV